jgi:hypothetical protein
LNNFFKKIGQHPLLSAYGANSRNGELYVLGANSRKKRVYKVGRLILIGSLIWY